MSTQTNKIAEKISRLFKFPENQFYRIVRKVLIGGDMVSGDGFSLLLDFLCKKESSFELENKKNKISSQAAWYVLKHVVYRTLPFGKIFEFISHNAIIKGIPSIGVAGCPLKKWTVSNALQSLVYGGFLIKLQVAQSHSNSFLYAINLPLILNLLDTCWREAIGDINLDEEMFKECINNNKTKRLTGMARSIHSRRTQKLLELLIDYLEPFEEAFTWLRKYKNVIQDIEAFTRELSRICPALSETDSYFLIEGEKNVNKYGHHQLYKDKKGLSESFDEDVI